LDHATALGRLLSDNDAAARHAALEAFTALPPEDLAVCAHLLRPLLLGTRSPKSKRLALGALLKLRPQDLWQFLDDLVGVLEDPAWRVRLAAVCALEHLGPRMAEVGMAARAVAAQLRGPSQLCCAALRVLGRFDPKRFEDLAPVVAQRLREEGASFCFYVLEEMSGLGPEVLRHHTVAIISTLADSDWRVREAALKVAGRLAPGLLLSAVGCFAGLLGDPAAPVSSFPWMRSSSASLKLSQTQRTSRAWWLCWARLRADASSTERAKSLVACRLAVPSLRATVPERSQSLGPEHLHKGQRTSQRRRHANNAEPTEKPFT